MLPLVGMDQLHVTVDMAHTSQKLKTYMLKTAQCLIQNCVFTVESCIYTVTVIDQPSEMTDFCSFHCASICVDNWCTLFYITYMAVSH